MNFIVFLLINSIDVLDRLHSCYERKYSVLCWTDSFALLPKIVRSYKLSEHV